MDGDRDFNGSIEVWFKPAILSVCALILGLRYLLELSKLLPVELCALLCDVDPEAAMSADGGCAFNRKPDSYGRIALGGQVDVPSSDIRAPVILERE